MGYVRVADRINENWRLVIKQLGPTMTRNLGTIERK
jgi:hypothetical protein